MKKYLYILFFITIALSDEITLIGDSEPFIVDSQLPEVSWVYPNEGAVVDIDVEITLEWQAFDESFSDAPISIYISTSVVNDYELIISEISNSGSASYTFPDILTDYARLKVVAEDAFGYISESESGYFTINGTGGNDDGGDDGGHFEDELILISDSEPFIVDTRLPQIELHYPNGGEFFDQGQQVEVTWSASDESLSQNPITISISTNQGVFYDILGDQLENSGSYLVILPNESTAYGRIKVKIIDLFGYTAFDESDTYFSISGEGNDYTVSDTLLVLETDSDPFITDTVDPVITIIYPNGGEHITDYENVNLQWTVADESFENYQCTASVSSQLGGYYTMVDDDVPVWGWDNTYDINMAVQGVQETLWARMQMDVADDFGNTAEDKSDGYFILGSPEGELTTELVDDEDLVILDWGWQVGHLIAIHQDAVAFMNPGDIIQIIDENAIISESCESEYTQSVLASSTYTGEEGHLAFKALAGVDLCSEGGSRFPGYVNGNQIIIKYVDSVLGESISLSPNIEQVTGELIFDDEITIIYGFENADNRSASTRQNQAQFSNHNSEATVSINDRDFDSYNVYRTTNQVNLRDCEDEEGCSLIEGVCQCLIANNVPQSFYFDNYSSEQEEWCYDVWLLDNQTDQNEILKTIDSCVGLNIDLIFGDANEDGIVNILDLVQIANYIIGNLSLSDVGLIQADFNQDGIINILDLVQIVQFILNLR